MVPEAEAGLDVVAREEAMRREEHTGEHTDDAQEDIHHTRKWFSGSEI